MTWLSEAWRRLRGRRLVISMDSVDTQGPEYRWPPTAADESRLAAYDMYLKLFLGRHQEVFDPYRLPDRGPYVVSNVLGAISRLTAHRLFGEAPKARVKQRAELGGASPEPAAGIDTLSSRELRDIGRQQELLDFLCQSNAWQQLCHGGALGGSYRGDAVLKVRYDAQRDAVVIDDVPPNLYFPHLDENHQETVRAVSLAWVVAAATDPVGRTYRSASDLAGDGGGPVGPPYGAARGDEIAEGRVAWLREEYHEPGRIENRLWKLVATPSQDHYYRRRVELSALNETADLPEVVETGLDVIPIVHIPNRKVAETGIWGQSDYADLITLQEALNRRRTQTGHILDKHADPLLAIDESFLDENGRLPMDRVRAIPLVQDEPPPQYITWDGKLADSRAEAQELLHTILLVAGISPESLGFGSGSFPESGLAIRLRQILTTSTVAGKRLQWESGLRSLLSIATRMYVTHVRDKRRTGLAGVRALEPEEIGIEFGDGLPRDSSAAIKDEVALQQAGLASQEGSLKRLFPDWSEAEIQAELSRLAPDRS